MSFNLASKTAWDSVNVAMASTSTKTASLGPHLTAHESHTHAILSLSSPYFLAILLHHLSPNVTPLTSPARASRSPLGATTWACRTTPHHPTLPDNPVSGRMNLGTTPLRHMTSLDLHPLQLTYAHHLCFALTFSSLRWSWISPGVPFAHLALTTPGMRLLFKLDHDGTDRTSTSQLAWGDTSAMDRPSEAVPVQVRCRLLWRS